MTSLKLQGTIITAFRLCLYGQCCQDLIMLMLSKDDGRSGSWQAALRKESRHQTNPIEGDDIIHNDMHTNDINHHEAQDSRNNLMPCNTE